MLSTKFDHEWKSSHAPRREAVRADKFLKAITDNDRSHVYVRIEGRRTSLGLPFSALLVHLLRRYLAEVIAPAVANVAGDCGDLVIRQPIGKSRHLAPSQEDLRGDVIAQGEEYVAEPTPPWPISPWHTAQPASTNTGSLSDRGGTGCVAGESLFSCATADPLGE